MTSEKDMIQKKKKKKRHSKGVSIFCGILFFIIGCFGGMLATSGMLPDLIDKAKEVSSDAISNTSSKKLYIRTTKKEQLNTFAILAQTEGILQAKGGSRMNFQLVPGLSVGSDTESDEKVIYLTFDDGPSYNTEKILKILDKYNAKATFFVTGINSNYVSLIKKEADQGHTVGLHTMSHDYAKLYASEDAYFKDLEKIGNLVKEQIGYVPCFIRFPGGSSNTVSANYSKGIMSKLSKDVIKKGYQYYDWNGDSEDGSGTLSADALVKNAENCSGNNIVILCHDAIGKETTVKALPRIIKHFQDKGYVFRGIDRESYAPHHGVNN